MKLRSAPGDARSPAADTIFALSSAPGRAGIAVIRLSGPYARRAVETLTRRPCPGPRAAALRRLWTDVEIDEALVLWFEAPASFTGEDVAEFHVHGGRAVLGAVEAALTALGLRPAEAGEFTRRAVENAKLDLTRAEAIADLVDAETEAQRRQALRQYDGALADLYEAWRARLVKALAWAEAEIDFSDEGVEGMARARLAAKDILMEIQIHLDDSCRGELLREGIHLTLVGPPNAGKSSLLNALAGRDLAIVTPIPGTTRDIVEARMNFGGYLVNVADTAGLRETSETIEAEGVRRALARARDSELVLLLLDGSAGGPMPAFATADLVVWNKADLRWPEPAGHEPRCGLRLSLKTGEGLEELTARITELVRARLEAPGEVPALTRPRHRAALHEAVAALGNDVDAPELLAENLRMAVRALGRITGSVDIEELLDAVFRDFCIGK